MAIPLGLAALASAGPVALASVTVGNASETTSQSNVGSQTGSQKAGGGTVVGPVNQTAGNDNVIAPTTITASAQTIGSPGGTQVGNTVQTNAQGNLLIQGATQTANGPNGLLVGPLTQTSLNGGGPIQNSAQNVDGATFVGSPVQANAQYVGFSQGAAQNDPGVTIVGAGAAVTQNATNGGGFINNATQRINDGAAATLVGSASQTNGQTSNIPQYVGQNANGATIVGSINQGPIPGLPLNFLPAGCCTTTYAGLIF